MDGYRFSHGAVYPGFGVATSMISGVFAADALLK